MKDRVLAEGKGTSIIFILKEFYNGYLPRGCGSKDFSPVLFLQRPAKIMRELFNREENKEQKRR